MKKIDLCDQCYDRDKCKREGIERDLCLIKVLIYELLEEIKILSYK